MSVERALETYINVCRKCKHKWRVICEVDLIHWGTGDASILSPKEIQCPVCMTFSERKKMSERDS
jgi:hypothetical protein